MNIVKIFFSIFFLFSFFFLVNIANASSTNNIDNDKTIMEDINPSCHYQRENYPVLLEESFMLSTAFVDNYYDRYKKSSPERGLFYIWYMKFIVKNKLEKEQISYKKEVLDILSKWLDCKINAIESYIENKNELSEVKTYLSKLWSWDKSSWSSKTEFERFAKSDFKSFSSSKKRSYRTYIESSKYFDTNIKTILNKYLK